MLKLNSSDYNSCSRIVFGEADFNIPKSECTTEKLHMCSRCCISHRVRCLMILVVYWWSFNCSAVVWLHTVYEDRCYKLAGILQRLQPITLTKQSDVHLLQGMNAAELIKFMVNLVEY